MWFSEHIAQKTETWDLHGKAKRLRFDFNNRNFKQVTRFCTVDVDWTSQRMTPPRDWFSVGQQQKSSD